MQEYAKQIQAPKFDPSTAKSLGKIKGRVVFNNGDEVRILTEEGNVVQIYRGVDDTQKFWKKSYPFFMSLELDKMEVEMS